MTVQSTFVPEPVPRRGSHDSDDYNDMIAGILTDLNNLVTQANKNEVSIQDLSKLLFSEFMNARNASRMYFEDVRRDSLIKANLSERIYNFVDFRAFRGPEYYLQYGAIPMSRRCRVEPMYGQVLLPYNYLLNRFYYLDPETNLPVLPDALDYELTGEDNGGTVTQGTVEYAFNGNNRDYWIRKVSFPMESDVDSVAVTLVVTTPDTLVDRSNMITLHAFPLGQCEIEELKYSTDAGDPTTDIPGFTPVRSAGFLRWHFDDIAIAKLKITIRQRNFVEENGQKVFYLGAQEIGLKLIELDKTTGEPTLTDNNGVICVLEAPTGYKFDWLRYFTSDPAYATVTNESGIRFRVYTDELLTQLAWSSYDHPRLQDTPVYVGAANTTKLYVLTTLEYLQALNLSPLLTNFVMGYDVI